MTSLLVEQLQSLTGRRDTMATDAARERTDELLAGRTVWCAAALAGPRRSAEALRANVARAGPGIAASSLPLSGEELLEEVAQRLLRMLAGEPPGQTERETLAERVRGDEAVAHRVLEGDVVIAHDAVSSVVGPAARERGAHVVWRLQAPDSSPRPNVGVLELLRRLAPGVDAHVLTWRERGRHGEVIERTAAAMPSAGIVAAKQFRLDRAAAQARELAWRMVLAEIVRSDREECVGGTLHPRPAVAAR